MARISLALPALIALSLAFGACHPSGGQPSDTTAITNRPTNPSFIAILKLQTPALLSSAQKVDGKVQVDETLKQEIDDEQTKMIATLTALSPDIKVLYRYKMVLNGLAVVAPIALEAQFRGMDAVSYVEGEGTFDRMAPVTTVDAGPNPGEDINAKNSVTWIGGDKVHASGVTGKGIVVGVIDTGIDYTHAMFGGAGTADAYNAIDPSKPNPGFPTAKVIGGLDLVGTDYDDAAGDFAKHVPVPDSNPLDEYGHGTHVSGTIAGQGDGINTYSGVAPDAKLYALKIFGKEGSVGDAVIIEALELAADPSGQMDPTDHLDVVNLSLGGGFGSPHTLYAEAVKNLVNGDTVMVAAAGNSGANDYIVGSPSTADDAISVAAEIDGMDHNWHFNAVQFATAAHPSLIAEAIEASFSKPIAQAGAVTGKLVYVGTAATDLTDAQKAAVKGNVALIDRGVVAFADKATRANDAGAIGLVVANNVDGDAFVMGGDGAVPFPAIMITKALADELKADMASGDATIAFQSTQKIEKPELIDTITDFSSRGPRSIDGALKPEITAPGSNVISAKMGSGNLGVQFSGTSMATPHMSGVLALLKQAHPELDARALKALVMQTSLTLVDPKAKAPYPVATMGAGRVQADLAATAKLLADPPALSLGEVLVEQAKTVQKTVTLTNLADAAVTLAITSVVKTGLEVTAPTTLALNAHETKSFDLRVKITPPTADDSSLQLDGYLNIVASGGDSASYHLPLLAVIDRTTHVAPQDVIVHATSADDAAGAVADLTIANQGALPGDALLFNLLGESPRKDDRANPTRNGICDLESAGWRVTKAGDKTLVQFAVKLYNPVTTWQLCDVSVLIDKDGSGIPAQELLGTVLQELSQNDADYQTYGSFLTDASKMRAIEKTWQAAPAGTAAPTFTDAIVDMQPYQVYGHSTVAMLTADLSQLATTPTGDLRIKLVVSTDTTSPQDDDYLGNGDWMTLTPTADGLAFVDLPDTLTLAAGAQQTVSLTKGNADGNLVVYLPYNRSTESQVATDDQAKILAPKYLP